ncbi:MAG: hypothetical protein LIO96_04540, partial [Lachnospiraceae bacterium]|nr:hypothetical protein [Lachnospiraceae bacterium]
IMNDTHIQQIFAHYIDKFDNINNQKNCEYYKWLVAKKFRFLMDEALNCDDGKFADALYKVKVSTENIIDSYTQPFHGLVEFARREPKTVRQMFLDLYEDDGGDLSVQQEKISDFFKSSRILLEKYFPGGYRYEQNSHSVSAYLFLYDPDHHYMYKATQAGIFADCIEFYDDWGTGDNIKLDVYYRMCDWIVEQIKSTKELLDTDAGRFALPEGNDMFPDTEKHMLAFDLIYCCSVYDLFDGISFTRPKSKDKQLIVENKKKAAAFLEEYNNASDEMAKLREAETVLESKIAVGTRLVHKKWGEGEVVNLINGNMEVYFPKDDSVRKLGMRVPFANDLMSLVNEEDDAVIKKYVPLLKRKKSIETAVSYTERQLRPYKEFLE